MLKKKHFKPTVEKIIILLALVFIYGLTAIPALETSIVEIFVGMMVLFAVIAATKKQWFDVILSLGIGVAFFAGRLKFNQIDDLSYTFRTAATLAFVLLNLALFIGPWSRYTKHFQQFYKHRRHIGVSMFLLALLHASLILDLYFNLSYAQAFTSTFVFFGATALWILGVLALTSWDHVQVKWKNSRWKITHTVLLAAYVGLTFYMKQHSLDLEAWHQWLLGAFVVFWLLVGPWALPKLLLKQVKGWKQLHVLIYIAYAAVITHVWTGVVQLQDPWLQASFWTLVAVTVTSHAIGWIMVIGKHWTKKRAGQEKQINGHNYVPTSAVDSFEDGKGQRFEMPSGLPIAVFKNGDSFFALAAICPHQNGPIEKGEIVNGYVECPWHKWQFNTEDGSGPPDYPDCIPYYDVAIDGGMVYVATEANGKCQDHDGHTEYAN